MNPVKFSDLSNISVEYFLAEHEKFSTPNFLWLKYSGEYKPGSEGKGDALFIMASAEAAHKAWYSKGVVFDFTDLEYTWGDEMSWVFGFGYDRVTRCEYPVAIVVSDKCSDALKSLEPAEFKTKCVGTEVEATKMILEKYETYGLCLKEWKPK